MSLTKPLPVALTIAGSDSGGGAGIQADLNTFAALGVHGTCAVTCLTAQNPTGVRAIQSAASKMVRQQIEAVCAELPPRAIKTGMLYSTEIIMTVVDYFERRKRVPLVVDPVMVATSGARLLELSAIEAMRHDLIPLATLVTPNLAEASLLLGRKLLSVDDLRTAARELHDRWGCAALVKGGHLEDRDLREAVDLYFDGKSELLLTAPRVTGISTHGTGCTYSAAIAGYLAQGQKLPEAVQNAKQFITQAIHQSRRISRHHVLGWLNP